MGSNWPEFPIKEIALGIFDGPHATPKRREAGAAIYLGISSLDKGRIDLSKSDFVSDKDFTKWTRRVTPQPGDLVFSYETRLGEAATIPHDLRCCLGRRMGLVRPDPDKVDSRYLLYAYLGSEFQEVLRRHTVQGATVERILLTEFPDFPLRVPPLPEQRRIAAVLGALDDKIELNRKMNRTLEEMAQAIFKSWFIDFDGHDDLVNSELGPIPRGWSAGTLEAVADLNPTSWSQKTHPDTVEYIDLSNTSAGQVFDVVSYAWNDAPSRARRVLEPWDTIFGCVRPANRSYALIHESGWTGSTGFAVLRGKKSAYAPFIYLAAVEDSNVARLARVADGAAYPAVRPNVVHESPVVVPDEETLIRFNEVTRPLLARIAHNDRESRTLADLRDTLLPKLISGELRVPEAEAAVGSVL